jgi:hypothetical protein
MMVAVDSAAMIDDTPASGCWIQVDPFYVINHSVFISVWRATCANASTD